MFTGFFSRSAVTDYESAAACDRELYEKFFKGMLENGIFFAPSQFEASFFTCALGEPEIDRTIEACEKVFSTIRSTIKEVFSCRKFRGRSRISTLMPSSTTVQSIRSHLSPGAGLLGVVKADAYGHGAVEISKKLESIGIDYLGVATIDEGIDLRSGGIIKPVLIMSGIFSWDDVEPVVRYDLTPVVYDGAILGKAHRSHAGFREAAQDTPQV